MQHDDTEIRLQLRLPRDLHADLASLATAEERSLNGQIVYTLRRGLDWYQGIAPTAVDRVRVSQQPAPPATGRQPRPRQ